MLGSKVLIQLILSFFRAFFALIFGHNWGMYYF